MKHYDYLLAGAGLYNAVIAGKLISDGKSVLVVEKRNHIGGNVYCENIEGINVHKYGAHIFHTNDKEVWDYVNALCEFNRYTNSPVANYKGEIYNLPFNMNTFNKMWGVATPKQAREKIEEQRKELAASGREPGNLEEQAISLVGRDIYMKLVKGYTEKQWGRDCTKLPAFIIKRLPVRFTYDNNYFNDRYQGIPIGGYNRIIEKLYDGADIKLGCDFNSHRQELMNICDNVIYTGPIDAFFDFSEGRLEYRSLRFETSVLDETNYQGNAVVNYTDRETPYTRIIEHKHFEFGTQEKTVITKEYPEEFKDGTEPYYPVNDERNQSIYAKYKKLAEDYNNAAASAAGEEAGAAGRDCRNDSLKEKSGRRPPRVYFGGRLGEYKYYDMDKVIRSALDFCAEKL